MISMNSIHVTVDGSIWDLQGWPVNIWLFLLLLVVLNIYYHGADGFKHTHIHCAVAAAQADRIILTLVITKACVEWMFYYLIFCHALLRFVVAAAHGLDDIPQGKVSTKANIVQGKRGYRTREGRAVLYVRPRHLPQTLYSVPYSSRIVLLHLSVLFFPICGTATGPWDGAGDYQMDLAKYFIF